MLLVTSMRRPYLGTCGRRHSIPAHQACVGPDILPELTVVCGGESEALYWPLLCADEALPVLVYPV